MVKHLENAGRKVAGLKQVLREAQAGTIERVYIAKDAEDHLKEKVSDALKNTDVKLIEVDTMDELGAVCGIKVGAACAAVLKEDRS